MASQVLTAVLCFFGRLIRDIWLELWRPLRRWVVRIMAVVAAALAFLLIIKNHPDVFAMLLTYGIIIGVMVFGLKMILGGVFPKKKKKRR